MLIRGNQKLLEKKVARIMARIIRRIAAQQGTVILGVPGGRSVGGLLRCLGHEDVEWDNLHLFMVDERFVPLDSPDSNFGRVASSVTSFIAAENLHPFIYDPAAANLGVDVYRDGFLEYGGRFDIILLSSGEDGHVASLFPEHESIDNPEEFFIMTHSAPKPPPSRMSASRWLLTTAQAAVLLFFGQEKQAAFSTFLDERQTVRQCPAKLVRDIPEHFILTDRSD